VGASLRAYCLQEPGVAVAVLRAGPGESAQAADLSLIACQGVRRN
jgi:hypothetical protein